MRHARQLILLLLFPVVALGQIGPSKIGTASIGVATAPASGGGGACSVLSESWSTGTSAYNQPIGSTSGNSWVSCVFIASNSVVDCQIVFTNITKNGTPPGNFTVMIYSDGGNKPGSDLTSGGATVTASSLTTGSQTFNLTMSSKTSGTQYWVVMHASAVGDSGNDLVVSGDQDLTYLFFPMGQNSSDGTTWSSAGSQVGYRLHLNHS